MSSTSPGVVSKEIDLTFRVQSVGGFNGAMAGVFQWGPIEQPIFISSGEDELIEKFHTPDDNTAISFLSAANYLLYSNSLYVVRVAGDDALNAVSVGAGNNPILIKNESVYETLLVGEDGSPAFFGKYAGSLINGVTISWADSATFSAWEHKEQFEYAPSSLTEFNILVVDTLGTVSGTAGSVLEKFELVSTVEGTKRYDGTNAYYKDVINSGSAYLWVGFTPFSELGSRSVAMFGGVDDNDISGVDLNTAYDLLSNPESISVSFLFSADATASQKGYMLDIVDSREDCIGFVSPQLDDVKNNINVLTDVLSFRNTECNKNTSYGFMDDNWKLVYDRYNDVNRWIPCSSDCAGLTAQTYIRNEPWYSPAGYSRGQIKNVIKLAWNPNRTQRDQLYKAQINSVVSFPGEGTFLYGDKTLLTRPSAFDRINVRSLFIVLRATISRAAKYQLFEFNDEITRSLFRNANTAYLKNVQAKRGVYDSYVKCDDKNNTPYVIDSNRFVGSIFVKPARSINYIELNFVAVDSGASFSEIENAIA